MASDPVIVRKRVTRMGLLFLCAHVVFLVGLLLRAVPGPSPAPSNLTQSGTNGFGSTYHRDVVSDIPWSIHVIRIDRKRKDLELQAAFGKGTAQGLATLSEQIKALPGSWGRPLAGINGDFYHTSKDYPGDPDGLQIVRGELVSAPSANRACFWIDADGNPHRGDVQSQFKVIWPTGKSTPIGLNQERENDAAVLYTRAIGETTRTSGGVDLVLDSTNGDANPVLQIGQTYSMVVSKVNSAGNSSISRGSFVLSLGPKLLSTLPATLGGMKLKISTATTPDLKGAKTAIGGGPTLVAAGRARQWSSPQLRHPRTALGWNSNEYFLIEVDGRQPGLSVGMTFSELADYMIKLGCEEAINLDGGGSATCWYLGQVMNSPSEGQERAGANSLVLLQKRTP